MCLQHIIVIPVFSYFHFTGPMRWLYERTRLVLFPIYGFFPVKLRTFIGEPIPYDPSITAEELAKKVMLIFIPVLINATIKFTISPSQFLKIYIA